MHAGEERQALALARKISGPSQLTSTASLPTPPAGIGYESVPGLFKDMAEEGAAAELAAKTRDISEFLVDLGWETPPPSPTR